MWSGGIELSCGRSVKPLVLLLITLCININVITVHINSKFNNYSFQYSSYITTYDEAPFGVVNYEYRKVKAKQIFGTYKASVGSKFCNTAPKEMTEVVRQERNNNRLTKIYMSKKIAREFLLYLGLVSDFVMWYGGI